MQESPRLVNPEEAAKAKEVMSRPVDTPYGHTDLTGLKPAHVEEMSPSPSRLDPDKTWFFPGLAYCMMGLQQSLFELLAWELGRDVKVISYKASSPLAQFVGVDVVANPWFYTLQGVDPDIGALFAAYIASFEFKGKDNNCWKICPTNTEIWDPFPKVVTSVPVILLLPDNVARKRRVQLLESKRSTACDSPVLGMVQYE